MLSACGIKHLSAPMFPFCGGPRVLYCGTPVGALVASECAGPPAPAAAARECQFAIGSPREALSLRALLDLIFFRGN